MQINNRTFRMALMACLLLALNGSRIYAVQNPIPGTSLVPTAWYAADQGVSLVSGAVNVWTDLSGNGNDAKQTTAANRPTFVDEITPNGKPTLRFDGTDRLVLTTSLLSQNWTCFTVARPDWNNNQKSFFGGATGAMQWRVRRNGETTRPGCADLLRRAQTGHAAGTTKVSTNEFSLLSAFAKKDTSDVSMLRLNRAADGVTSTTTLAFTTASGEIGASGSADYMVGDIAALVVFTNALTEVEIASVEKYLYSWYTQFPPTLITLR